LLSERDLRVFWSRRLAARVARALGAGRLSHTAHRDVCLFVEGSKGHLVADLVDVVGVADVAQPVLARRKAEVGRWRFRIKGTWRLSLRETGINEARDFRCSSYAAAGTIPFTSSQRYRALRSVLLTLPTERPSPRELDARDRKVSAPRTRHGAPAVREGTVPPSRRASRPGDLTCRGW
jgi:hypothetical protein